jgi:hypothetical protein
MTKKKTKKATTKKPSAKVKTQTITTENFGELVLKHDYEKDIIIKTNELMTARKKSDNIIVELGIAIQPYLLKNKKVTLDMKTVKQYVFDLVGYQKGNIKKSTFAKTNEGFEADVSRAVKLAFVSTSRKNTGIYIDEKTKSIKGISKKVHPVLEVKTPDGKDFKPHKNNSAEILDNIKIDRVMKAFDEVIMGKNISNKKTSKATPKDNKVKTVTIDTKINDVMNFTAELNACSVKDLADKYKGTTQKRLVQIALNVLRLEAKKTNEKISENGNVKNDNEILFSGKTQNIITWNKASWKNAVADLSQQPKVANK